MSPPITNGAKNNALVSASNSPRFDALKIPTLTQINANAFASKCKTARTAGGTKGDANALARRNSAQKASIGTMTTADASAMRNHV